MLPSAAAGRSRRLKWKRCSRRSSSLPAKAIELAQPQAPPELARMLAGGDDPLRMCFLLASMLSLETAKEQALLEASPAPMRCG